MIGSVTIQSFRLFGASRVRTHHFTSPAIARGFQLRDSSDSQEWGADVPRIYKGRE